MARSNVVASVAAGLLLLSVAPASAAVNLLTNGSFEAPTVGNFYDNYGPGIPGWTVTTNNVDIVTQLSGPFTGAAYQGTQYLDLVGFGSTGGVSQTFTTVAGRTYDLFFAFSNNPGSTSSAAAAFTIAGLSGEVSHSGAALSDLNWSTYKTTFVATSYTSTLAFTNTVGGNNGGLLLDSVSVSSGVPEPSTWAMMLLGLAGLGYFSVRRGKKAAAAL